MSKNELFIEYREQEGDYAVRRPGAARASATEPTQAEAIDTAREIEPAAAILVERVRNTNVGGRDKWRKPWLGTNNKTARRVRRRLAVFIASGSPP
jgi:hypothetical protein